MATAHRGGKGRQTARRGRKLLLDRKALGLEVTGRYRDILEAAAQLFAERGYAGTSVRDIGQRVGLLGGSLYHHIRSKAALFIKIHDLALQAAAERVQAAVEDHADPWKRLEAACVTMMQVQLDPNSLTMPLMNDFRSVPAPVRAKLVAKRDEFELQFVALVAALPLDGGFDRKIYRLLLLTLLNNISAWYRPGAMSPDDLGRQVAALFRHAIR